MHYQHIALSYPKPWHGGVAQLTLSRPEKHNAFAAQTIAELSHALSTLSAEPTLRLLILNAEGKHFCAGADLQWMQQQAQKTDLENRADAEKLSTLLHQLDTLPCPTLTLVQGCAFGGALGLIACSDVVIAQPHSRFCLSEVKIGLIPATISPYVSRAIGLRHLRRYALTAEPISAEIALILGLIHQVSESLESAAQPMIKILLESSPQAQRATKALLHEVANRPLDLALRQDTAMAIAQVRASAEAQEGLDAFFSQRPPAWRLHHDDH